MPPVNTVIASGSGNRFLRLLAGWIALLALVAACRPASAPPQPAATRTAEPAAYDLITLHYNERPPYLVTTENGISGLTGDQATIVFERSKIPFRWQQTPSKRQIYILQQNRGRDCLVGWFKTMDRETFARYTLPIYQDKPQIALARSDNAAIPAETTVEILFTNPQLKLLVKDGYSYGDFLDSKIKQYDPVRTETTVENREMLKMVYTRRADYFLIAPEEANGLIESTGFDLQDFKFIHFSDIPYGENRYILCSMQVEEAVIEQLNAAIRQYYRPSPP